MENPGYYAVIPANVRYAKIPPNAKLLYGEITALCSKEGYCWASNDYFAQLYDVKSRAVSDWIRFLKEEGFITYEIFDQTKRKIYLGENSRGGYVKKDVGVGENSLHSITSSNTDNPVAVATESIEEHKVSETEDFRPVRKKKVNPQMEEVFDLFKDNPARFQWRLFENQRVAAEILYREFGIETLRSRYAIAQKYRKDELCPLISNPSQFLEKMKAMERFLANQN